MTRAKMPPAIPPTMGPHFLADIAASEALSAPVRVGLRGLAELGSLSNPLAELEERMNVWVGVGVDAAGKERERVVGPAGAFVEYNEAELDAWSATSVRVIPGGDEMQRRTGRPVSTYHQSSFLAIHFCRKGDHNVPSQGFHAYAGTGSTVS